MNRRNFFKSALGLVIVAASGLSLKSEPEPPIKPRSHLTKQHFDNMEKLQRPKNYTLSMQVDNEWVTIGTTNNIKL